ncbi:hypothetical protein PF008_g29337 [Phytophthora fragariae]|uniref:Uncharacterized protein n=1 Tax=Phytophthora fragariae TaxID=53985 RepID=A0A6G0Q8R9_9STRA|nr:hypothetical protein PF008_g29337 [Phytophthora fragariae]
MYAFKAFLPWNPLVAVTVPSLSSHARSLAGRVSTARSQVVSHNTRHSPSAKK